MSDYVLWLDSNEAMIFALRVTGIEKQHLKRSGVDHHTQNKKDQHGDETLQHFFREVTEKLTDVDKLLIIGHGLAKQHFKGYLDIHPASGLAKKVIGVEICDHPTENQVLALARKFFKDYDLFNKPI